MRQTWYQSEGSKLAEMWTILHLPYTLMNLSFVTIGFGIAGVQRWDVFGWILLAYFLGLAIAAHTFDQLPGAGSHYIKYLSSKELVMFGLPALIISVDIGAYWMVKLGAWHLLWIIPLQTFFVWAYPNSEFMGGRFHNDEFFAFSFGFIPVIAGFYINNLSFSTAVIPWALVAFTISLIEITLSRYVRTVRKDSSHADLYLIKPEKALKLLCLMSYLLALAVIL